MASDNLAGQVDLSRYTLETYMRIVTFKTAFYSFFLPVACGLILAGKGGGQDLQLAKDICLQMGQYFQVGSADNKEKLRSPLCSFASTCA